MNTTDHNPLNQRSRTLQRLQKLITDTVLEEKQLTVQEIIGPYKVDLVSNEKKLVIEIDDRAAGKAQLKDRYFRRDHFLAGLGYKVLRFRKNQIYHHPEEVTRIIEDFLETYSKKF